MMQTEEYGICVLTSSAKSHSRYLMVKTNEIWNDLQQTQPVKETSDFVVRKYVDAAVACNELKKVGERVCFDCADNSEIYRCGGFDGESPSMIAASDDSSQEYLSSESISTVTSSTLCSNTLKATNLVPGNAETSAREQERSTRNYEKFIEFFAVKLQNNKKNI